jgi:AraC-like DNA-binding protein
LALLDASTLSLEVVSGARIARLVSHRTNPRPCYANELLFAVVLARGCEATGREWPLRAISFTQGSPRDIQGHEPFFGIPLRYGQPRNEMMFDSNHLDAPCRCNDAELATFLDSQLAEFAERPPSPATFLHEVRQVIAEAIHESDPLLGRTAKRLGMSTRTLQRRLGEHGTSCKGQVDQVRKELAARFLKDCRVPIREVACRLGYADSSAFHHAFVRWTGMTPVGYRAAHRDHAVGGLR